MNTLLEFVVRPEYLHDIRRAWLAGGNISRLGGGPLLCLLAARWGSEKYTQISSTVPQERDGMVDYDIGSATIWLFLRLGVRIRLGGGYFHLTTLLTLAILCDGTDIYWKNTQIYTHLQFKKWCLHTDEDISFFCKTNKLNLNNLI